jgi:hypothetical protein
MSNRGRTVDDDDEVHEPEVLAALARVFEQLDKWLARRDSLPAVQPGSRSGGDDDATSPYQLTHAVEATLSHSLDHMHALRTMVADAGTIHMAAPFTLMRAALENAAVAAWLLLPDDRDERVRRRLLLALEDAADGYKVRQLSETSIIGETLEQRRARLADIGVAYGLPRSSLMGKMASWKTIVREAGAATKYDADHYEIMWRLCSGFTHGRSWSMLSTLQRTTVASVDDVFEVRLNAPAGAVLVVASTAAEVLRVALALHDRHRLAFREHHRE